MEFDSGGLEILGQQECSELLLAAPLGRIVFTQHALPAIQPVNFAVDGEDIIIRTASGSRLSAATANSVVAFEIDDFDRDRHCGWSVVIIGQARRVSDPAEIAALSSLALEPWAPGSRDQFIRIRPEIVTGRRISCDRPQGAEMP
jgi:nitroimidazol reductase NimA-like FMN-containing flavoprotein (pyridoxamine 5'-phosphate oxidase superfamily)